MMDQSKAPILQLLDVMRRLRDPNGGCPWDLEQNFATIAPYTIEEAYEVADAIDRGDMDDIKEELGDLLLQVVFHAQMANEEGHFNFDDVAQAITDKMIFRHPHVFGNENAENATHVLEKWEQRKDMEKQNKGKSNTDGFTSVLDDIPANLPSMLRAHKIQKKAVKEGFEWNDVMDVFDKVQEELDELKEAIQSGDEAHMIEEYGDVLFTVTNIGRKLGIDSEHALRQTNQKFIKRFRGMEEDCYADGKKLRDISFEEREALWNKQKAKG